MLVCLQIQPAHDLLRRPCLGVDSHLDENVTDTSDVQVSPVVGGLPPGHWHRAPRGLEGIGHVIETDRAREYLPGEPLEGQRSPRDFERSVVVYFAAVASAFGFR
jgi:hypothetical protein